MLADAEPSEESRRDFRSSSRQIGRVVGSWTVHVWNLKMSQFDKIVIGWKQGNLKIPIYLLESTSMFVPV